METKEKSNIIKIILGVTIGIVIGIIIGLLIATTILKDKITDNTNTNTSTNNESNTNNTVNKGEIMIQAFKDYYNSKGFVTNDKINTWDITIKENNENYIIVKNEYTCKEDNGQCIYTEQEIEENGKYIFTIKVNGKFEDNKYIITSVEQPGITIEGETVSNELDVNEYSKKLKEYLINKKLINQSNLTLFVVESIEYKGYLQEKPNEKWYAIKVNYSCSDGTPDCVYQAQRTENEYSFSNIIIISNNEIINVMEGVITAPLIK